MNRTEHLAWAKKRAFDLVTAGDLPGAIASVISDLGKHTELAGHIAIELGAALMSAGQLSNRRQVLEFINGIN